MSFRSFRICALAAFAVVNICAAQTFQTIYSFNGGSGSGPLTISLTQGRDGRLYGTTVNGGAYGLGTAFAITTTGHLSVLHSFNTSDGANPWGGLTLGTDGNFYGATQAGGPKNAGVVFKMTYAGTLTVLRNFAGFPTDGQAGFSPPIQAADGNLYGVSGYGGKNDAGVLYKITPSGGYSLLYEYNYATGYDEPSAPVQGSDGDLYVPSLQGGANACGSIVKFSTTGVVVSTLSFDCRTNGSYPESALVQGSDGNVYGIAYSSGGVNSAGTLFSLSPAGVFTVLHDFGTRGTGVNSPDTALTQATDGNFYGVTQYGGQNGAGGIYQSTSSGTVSTLYSFPANTAAEGALTQHTNGTLYSVTFNSGANSLGQVYSLDMGLGAFVAFVQPTGQASQTAQILGQGLTGSTRVAFNGVAATSFKVVSDTFLTAVIPQGATTGPVVVTTPTGRLTSNVKFRISN